MNLLDLGAGEPEGAVLGVYLTSGTTLSPLQLQVGACGRGALGGRQGVRLSRLRLVVGPGGPVVGARWGGADS